MPWAVRCRGPPGPTRLPDPPGPSRRRRWRAAPRGRGAPAHGRSAVSAWFRWWTPPLSGRGSRGSPQYRGNEEPPRACPMAHRSPVGILVADVHHGGRSGRGTTCSSDRYAPACSSRRSRRARSSHSASARCSPDGGTCREHISDGPRREARRRGDDMSAFTKALQLPATVSATNRTPVPAIPALVTPFCGFSRMRRGGRDDRARAIPAVSVPASGRQRPVRCRP